VVIVLVIQPKVRGFKPGRGRWILRVIKIRITTSFGGEAKLSSQCRMILRHIKKTVVYERDTSSAKFTAISRLVSP
jgi:hypothetical protein